MVIHKKDAEIGGRHARYGLTPVRGATENLGERFGDPGGPDPGEATSSAASASCMRERAAQSLNPEMGRMGAEDPSTAFSVAPLRRAHPASPGRWPGLSPPPFEDPRPAGLP